MAWGKKEKQESPAVRPVRAPAAATPTVQAPIPERETRRSDTLVNIGKSVQIKGELSGSEDVTIDGHVEGKISFRDHSVTIGPNGRINAQVYAKSVMIIGEVVGDISAEDRVEVAASGSIQGDISAPRVVLAEGARFRGNIDMEPGKSRAPQPTSSPSHSAPTAPQSAAPHAPPRPAAPTAPKAPTGGPDRKAPV